MTEPVRQKRDEKQTRKKANKKKNNNNNNTKYKSELRRKTFTRNPNGRDHNLHRQFIDKVCVHKVPFLVIYARENRVKLKTNTIRETIIITPTSARLKPDPSRHASAWCAFLSAVHSSVAIVVAF
jgi:hypothetical protein